MRRTKLFVAMLMTVVVLGGCENKGKEETSNSEPIEETIGTQERTGAIENRREAENQSASTKESDYAQEPRNSYVVDGITISTDTFSVEPFEDSSGEYTKRIVAEFKIKNDSDKAFGYITTWEGRLIDGYELKTWADIMGMNLKQVASGTEKSDMVYFLIDDSINADEIILSYKFMDYGESYWEDFWKFVSGDISEEEFGNKYGNFKTLKFSVKKSKEKSGRPEKDMMAEIKNWYIGDIWNKFVDFNSYRKSGKDCTGSDIDIEFAYDDFKESYALKDEYDSYINNLPGEYDDLKLVWRKMNEQIEKIYDDLETNGLENIEDGLELDLLSQYSDKFYEYIVK